MADLARVRDVPDAGGVGAAVIRDDDGVEVGAAVVVGLGYGGLSREEREENGGGGCDFRCHCEASE